MIPPLAGCPLPTPITCSSEAPLLPHLLSYFPLAACPLLCLVHPAVHSTPLFPCCGYLPFAALVPAADSLWLEAENMYPILTPAAAQSSPATQQLAWHWQLQPWPCSQNQSCCRYCVAWPGPMAICVAWLISTAKEGPQQERKL